MSKQFTTKDVQEHNTPEKVRVASYWWHKDAGVLTVLQGLYIIIDNSVYEMGGFVDEHPGGAKILKRVGGKDASKQFWKVCTYGRITYFQESHWLIVKHSTTTNPSSRSTNRG